MKKHFLISLEDLKQAGIKVNPANQRVLSKKGWYLSTNNAAEVWHANKLKILFRVANNDGEWMLVFLSSTSVDVKQWLKERGVIFVSFPEPKRA